MVEIKLGDQPRNPRDKILARFLEIFVYDNLPAQYVPKLALYRIASPEGETFWSTLNSSPGLQTQASLIEALNEAVSPEGGKDPSFERLPRQLMTSLLQSQFAGDLGEAAQTFSNLIMVLTELRPEQTLLYHDYFLRRVDLSWYSGVWTHAFFVEPTPYAGPDVDLWLVVWSDAWQVEPQLP